MTKLSPRTTIAAAVTAAALLAGALVAASLLGVHGKARPAPERAAGPAPSLFAGLPQDGATLGSPGAPVTLVEYADLQCPYCAQWARDALPSIVAQYVRTGKVRLVFNGLAFIGPDSDTALRTAIAAGERNHLWDVVHGLYARQGGENAGWVTDTLVDEIAAGVPGLNGVALREGRSSRTVDTELARAANEATAAGIASTPTFQVGPTGGRLEVVRPASLGPEGIVPAIEAALRA
jgi:protein-disulfide isomerase